MQDEVGPRGDAKAPAEGLSSESVRPSSVAELKQSGKLLSRKASIGVDPDRCLCFATQLWTALTLVSIFATSTRLAFGFAYATHAVYRTNDTMVVPIGAVNGSDVAISNLRDCSVTVCDRSSAWRIDQVQVRVQHDCLDASHL